MKMTEDVPVGIHADFAFLSRIREAEAQAAALVEGAAKASEIQLRAAQENAARRIETARRDEAAKRAETLAGAETLSLSTRADAAAKARTEAEAVTTTADARIETAAKAVAEKVLELHAGR